MFTIPIATIVNSHWSHRLGGEFIYQVRNQCDVDQSVLSGNLCSVLNLSIHRTLFQDTNDSENNRGCLQVITLQEKNCVICFESVIETNCMSARCHAHHICFTCLNIYMKQPSYNHPINGMGRDSQCPYDGCSSLYNITDVMNNIDNEAEVKLKLHLELLPEKCGFPFKCQNCETVTLFDLTTNDDVTYVNCGGSKKNICLTCAVTIADALTSIRVKHNLDIITLQSGCECRGNLNPHLTGKWIFGNRLSTGWFNATLSSSC